ncbi:3-deoxy-manno-octulosonate cytidylyltransferase [Magnetospira sp. QH-2]|uniref:3-deoxy-manno-octulosonate cytidylyltransferase n=1 Tax=Magnetospira sp. (strain QH-2) TaxID=1288970 RepID=UPI0003E812C3|nr:3-deoxy-manno-octulosonate cytidylyltransferase [Magnetospira sp. QH-2]CCQ75504.1 3-deoxy-manno-octulosonate cytidylyltransferase [Magnetospira sp. QH-2]
MKTVAVIPARMGSSRFPGKPLAPLHGRPMLEHVYQRTALSEAVSEVYIATCDDEIRSASEAFGAPVIMTADTHERASDRVAEAMADKDVDLVVMVQGDEPLTFPEMIDTAVAPFAEDPALQCVNLTKRIPTVEEFENPATIKVVMDGNMNALFMSREAIPHRLKGRFEDIAAYKQVCIIPFRHAALMNFYQLPPTPLEIAESVDMMRFIEHGIGVRMVETDLETHAVDTPEDLRLVTEMMTTDPLFGTY